MANTKAIRVRLMAYDHKMLDLAVEKILAVASKTNATKETMEILRRLDLPSGVDINIKF